MSGPPKRYRDRQLYGMLLREARPYWPHLAGIFVLSLLAAPLALLLPLPLKIAVDNVLGQHPLPPVLQALLPEGVALPRTSLLLLAAGLVLAIGLLVQLQGLGSWLLETYTGERLVLGFRARLFAHVQRLSLSYHDRWGSTDSTYRIQYDAPAIQWVLIHGITPLLSSGLMLVGMVVVTSRIDRQLAVVALAVAPVLFALRRCSSRRVRGQWYQVKEYESGAMTVVQEVLAALRVVKAFGQERREEQRFVQQASKGVRGQLRLALIQGGFDLLVGLTIAAGTAAVLVVGVRHVQAGSLTLGNLLLVMAYLAQLYGPLEMLNKKFDQLQGSLASADRAFALLDEVPDVTEPPDARRVRRAAGRVTFQEVSFAYRAGEPVLHDISFEVPPGARVGIMGTTGAGKSTLVSLLTRFYDPTAGRILLDREDLRRYRLDDLRRQFAIVLQEPVLFSASIAENIGYARPDAGRQEVLAAARAANAHEFIQRLPEGYGTQVGERGMRLSGGERQRISIARAFLKDAPILILDEPTASVDVGTEAAILEAMERLMRGRTTFIIAHRPSTLRHCDLSVRIEGGRLAGIAAGAPAPAEGAVASGAPRGDA
jgi:ATP-binding cassette subfamily B protein